VWALSFVDRGFDTRIAAAGEIDLADSPCIRCGQCSAHCPTGAIFEFDQTQEVWNALMNPDLRCVAQIAPAVRVSVGEAFGYEPGEIVTGQIYAALRRLGFDTVFDTNFGADVTIMEEGTEFVQRFVHGAGTLPLITTCCPSWVDFMEKYHHDMIYNFSSCKSPHAILGALTKTWYARQAKIPPEKIFMVSIMPCTSKKYEITRSDEMFASGQQDVDVSITTRELSRMIRQAGIDFDSLAAEDADNPLGEYTGAATIFGQTGGVMEAALRTAHYLITGEELAELEFNEIRGLKGVKEMEVEVAGKTVRIAVAHGCANVEQVMDKIRAARDANAELPYHFVEVMACPGGCVGGGGQSWGVTDEIRKKRAAALTADDRSKDKRCSHQNESVQKIYDDFIGKPLGEKAHELFHTRYKPRPQYRR